MGKTPLATADYTTAQQSARVAGPLNMIILHHGATTSFEAIVGMMVSGSREVSAHAVVKDKRIGGVVDEKLRAWSLSSEYWDSRAFTVECANESTDGWTISASSQESLAQLVADWATRYKFPIIRSGDPTTWTLLGHREVYTIYGDSYATACPGGMDLDWIAARANQIINGAKPQEDEDMKALIWHATEASKGTYPQYPKIAKDEFWAIGSPYDTAYTKIDKYKAQDMVLMGAVQKDNSGDNISVYVGVYEPLPSPPLGSVTAKVDNADLIAANAKDTDRVVAAVNAPTTTSKTTGK